MKRRNFILDSAASMAGTMLPRGWFQELCVAGRTGAPVIPATPGDAHETKARNAFLNLVRETLSPFSYEEGHYRAYFEWRYRNLPQSRHLYTRLAVQIPANPSIWDWIRGLLARMRGPSDLTLDVQTEILGLFSRTDLLILQGHRAWPGTPRGYSPDERPGHDG